MKIACPACGAEVNFKSKASVFGVCSYCNSTLVRHDLNIENLGKMTEMPQDMSPLQIGVTGRFKNSKFEIVGRQRIGWAGGAWNEWYLFFDNGKDGWLADAQGFYMVSFQIREEIKWPELSELKISDSIRLVSEDYVVDDIREVTCLSSQGELPVRGVKGRKSTSVDFTGENQIFANIDFSTEGNRLFIGGYSDFDSFNFMNLREIDGW